MLVTDVPSSRRTAYLGVDNANSGRTAAYLISKTLKKCWRDWHRIFQSSI